MHKCKTFKTFGNLPRSRRPSKFPPRSDYAMQCKVRRKLNTAYQHKDLVSTFHHADGGVMIFGLFLSHRTWAPCSHWVDHELLCIIKCFRVKREAISPKSKAWPKLGHATGQWSQAHQQIYNRMAEEEKNQDVALAQSKSRP